MSVEPRSFIESAKKILLLGCEVDHRNAASRAYYCMYHTVLNEVLEHVVEVPRYQGAGSHQSLILYLNEKANSGGIGKINEKECYRLSLSLGQGKVLRTVADYKISEPFRQVDAEVLIKSAERFLP